MHPYRVKDMLAYMRLVVVAAQRFKEGRGRLTYDSVFRQTNQGPSTHWETLDPMLHTAYVGGQGVPAVVMCRFCTGVDHPAESCALFPATKSSPPPRFGPSGGPGHYSGLLCKSWNTVNCHFPGNCYYRHGCSICGDLHKARYCNRPHPPPLKGKLAKPNHARVKAGARTWQMTGSSSESRPGTKPNSY